MPSVVKVDIKELVEALLMKKGEMLGDVDAMYEVCFRVLADEKKSYFDDLVNTFKEKKPCQIIAIVGRLNDEDIWESEEWVMPASAKESHKNAIRKHVEKCLEYVAYKEVLAENAVYESVGWGGVELEKALGLIEYMLVLHVKASQHVAAINLLRNHQKKSYDFRPSKGGVAKSIKPSRKVVNDLYRNLVRFLIINDPPRRGEKKQDVAQRYRDALISLNNFFPFMPFEKPSDVFQLVLDVLISFNFEDGSERWTYFERVRKDRAFSRPLDRGPTTLLEYGFYNAGLYNGLLLSVKEMVLQKFGEISDECREKLEAASLDELQSCLYSLSNAKSASDVFLHIR